MSQSEYERERDEVADKFSTIPGTPFVNEINRLAFIEASKWASSYWQKKAEEILVSALEKYTDFEHYKAMVGDYVPITCAYEALAKWKELTNGT